MSAGCCPGFREMRLLAGVVAVVCAVTVRASTVADLIQGNSDLSTLQSLLNTAGLGSALAGAGPFSAVGELCK